MALPQPCPQAFPSRWAAGEAGAAFSGTQSAAPGTAALPPEVAIFSPSAQTVSRVARPGLRRLASGSGQRLWMSIAGSPSGETGATTSSVVVSSLLATLLSSFVIIILAASCRCFQDCRGFVGSARRIPSLARRAFMRTALHPSPQRKQGNTIRQHVPCRTLSGRNSFHNLWKWC